ncbi:DUF4148 domain-containing protein [Burkholderia guangdongensis]|uniref:DUF4148 domain-containing protein n=1 Tax=Burkholderia guangdongensis TaxID=1792500 RepID=UPI0015C70979|nr:DUF4148 domain-containing protein [Burkholderia guangdongensis]
MKSIIYAALAASILAAPLASFAQSNGPITRDAVKADLIQLEQNGYRPNASDSQYPANVQAATQRVQAGQQTLTRADTSGYGSVATGAAQSGRPAMTPSAVDKLYFGQ